MRYHTPILILIICVMAAHVHGESDTKGWYIGPHIGSAQVSIKTKGSSSFEVNPTIYGIEGGIQITEWFGLESTFHKTARFESPRDGIYDSHLRFYTFAPKLSINISPDTTVYVKYGTAFIAYEENFQYSDTSSESTDWSSSAPTFGLGFQQRLHDHIWLRVGYEHFEATLDSGFFTWHTDRDPKLVSDTLFAGINYQF